MAWNFGFIKISTARAFSGSGLGTAANPYRINSCDKLQEMSLNLSAHYVIVEDIDCTGEASFQPIGVTGGTGFSGELIGNG